LTSSVGH